MSAHRFEDLIFTNKLYLIITTHLAIIFLHKNVKFILKNWPKKGDFALSNKSLEPYKLP